MQILLNMPDVSDSMMKKLLESDYDNDSLFDRALRSALKEAVILPKGHGNLKDVDRLESHDVYDGQGFTKSVYKDDIDNLLTIIEADKVESEDALCKTGEEETTTQENLLQTLLELEDENERLHDAFDKIWAEIEALPKVYPFYNHIDTYVKDDDVRKIINKYKDRK